MEIVCAYLNLSRRGDQSQSHYHYYYHLFLQNFLNESLKCIDKLFPVAAGQNGSGGGAGAEGLPLTGSDSAKMAAAAAAAALAAKNHNQRTAAAAAMMQGGVGGSDKNKAS